MLDKESENQCHRQQMGEYGFSLSRLYVRVPDGCPNEKGTDFFAFFLSFPYPFYLTFPK